MSHVVYSFVRLNDGLYDDELREKLGTFFDVAVNCCGLRGQTVADVLVASGLAEQLECQNPAFVAGRSGVELLEWALRECGYANTAANEPRAPVTPDYWVGYMLGLLQIRTCCPYARIFELVSYEDLRDMHSWCLDMSEDEVVEEMRAELASRVGEPAIKTLRRAAGITQRQLADQAGISMRAVQQYETGLKDINKAAAITVRKLSLVLGCRMEDLLEPSVQQHASQ